MKPTKSIWSGEARKVQRKTLAAIDARMGRNNISTLGRACQHRNPDGPAAAYADAMGWSLERAKEVIAGHEKALRDAGQPFNVGRRR